MLTTDGLISRFQELLRTQPRYNLKQVQVENCTYADTVLKSKNCYYTFGAFYSEDLLYSRYSRKCIDSADLLFCVGCQHCISCSDCASCYECLKCQNCDNCFSCEQCFECYGCKDCFGCIGLHRGERCVFNEQVDPTTYKKLVDEYRANPDNAWSRLSELRAKTAIPPLRLFRCDGSIGSNLSECSNCWYCFETFASEDCAFCIETNGNKSCADLSVCFENELCIQCLHSPLNYDCSFLFHVDKSAHSEICAYSKNLKQCFGCVGIADREFHILNEPCSRLAYVETAKRLRNDLIEKRLLNMKLFYASSYEQRRSEQESEPFVQFSPEIFKGTDIMIESIRAKCSNADCGRDFLIVPQEQKLYNQKQLPLPDSCPTCRHKIRMGLRSERQLYKRTCERCTKSILTTYPPEVKYNIVCQDCFWSSVV